MSCSPAQKFLKYLIGFCSRTTTLHGSKAGPSAMFHRTLSKDGAWCWFQDPRAVYIEGEHRRTYAGWVTKTGQLKIGFHDHDTGMTAEHTLKEEWEANDHSANSLLVLPDKRIMTFYTKHNKRGLFCKRSLKPEDINGWEKEIIVADTPAVTYSNPVYLSDEERFYVFWRGQTWKPTYSTSGDGTTWAEPRVLLEEKGREAHNIRPYTKVVSDGKSTIHFAFTDGHPRDESKNSVYYMKYNKGAFYRADGRLIGSIDNLPIGHSACDIVYNGKSNGIRAWIWDIALSPEGNPVIVYAVFPDEKDHRYRYACWNGRQWLDSEIVPAGKWFPRTPRRKTEREPHYSGGIGLDHADPSRLYLSREINGIFEIEARRTNDGGKQWEIEPITIDSRYDNVRPVVPSGYGGPDHHLLWMRGEYFHFTDFRTEIVMHLPGKETEPLTSLG